MPITLPLTSNVRIDTDTQKLLVALPSLESRLPNKEPEIAFLRRFLRNRYLHLTIHMYHKLRGRDGRFEPQSDFAVAQAAEVYCCVRIKAEDPAVRELLKLLTKPHIQAVLYTHDKIACGDYEPRIDPIPVEELNGDRAIKIVSIIKKHNEPLGATIQLSGETGCMEIARVLHGGAADRSGLISAGDELHEINGVGIFGMSPGEVVEMLSKASGSVTLKLVPSCRTPGSRKREMVVRALFSFDASTNESIPCREAGLSFQQGDILHIVNQEDSVWWQAYHHGDTSKKAGLIPSRHYHERQEVLRRSRSREGRSMSRSISPCRYSPQVPKQRRLRKTMYHIVQNGVFTDFDTDEIPAYDEVELYTPKPRHFRPIVLIGAPGIGRNELKRRLKASNPMHFQEVVPYTSREKKDFEEDGKEYRFLSRDEMEEGIVSQRFVEYGEYRGHLYGTSLESIKEVITSGKVCLLAPHTQALKFLRTYELKPYVIFIKSPSLEKLKESRMPARARATEADSIRPFTVEELEEMAECSRRIEERYGHVFDSRIVNDSLTDAMTELLMVASRLEKEAQWVPVGWGQ
ncbi:MAGUK p55 subfamily member 7-like [Babylonia areolata]|uniref:MAGUK p55 subfamily member 7-like n=1 Tax=Babylonia areolata TaxID=304850 RepID=UPI003FCF1C04